MQTFSDVGQVTQQIKKDSRYAHDSENGCNAFDSFQSVFMVDGMRYLGCQVISWNVAKQTTPSAPGGTRSKIPKHLLSTCFSSRSPSLDDFYFSLNFPGKLLNMSVVITLLLQSRCKFSALAINTDLGELLVNGAVDLRTKPFKAVFTIEFFFCIIIFFHSEVGKDVGFSLFYRIGPFLRKYSIDCSCWVYEGNGCLFQSLFILSLELFSFDYFSNLRLEGN